MITPSPKFLTCNTRLTLPCHWTEVVCKPEDDNLGEFEHFCGDLDVVLVKVLVEFVCSRISC